MERQRPPTETPDDGRTPSAERLHALAAGELPPAEAEALEAQVSSDPALRARYAEIHTLETALLGLSPLAPPADLAARIVAGLPTRGRVLSLGAVGRLAAAVVVVLGAWIVAFGTAPGLAHADTAFGSGALGDAGLAEAIEPARDLLPTPAIELSALEPANASPAALLGLACLGVVLLLLGLRVARRAHRRSPHSTAEETSS